MRLEDAMLLKTEKGATSQGIHVVSIQQKCQPMYFPLYPLEGMQFG